LVNPARHTNVSPGNGRREALCRDQLGKRNSGIEDE
jgi:hypothetical protein